MSPTKVVKFWRAGLQLGVIALLQACATLSASAAVQLVASVPEQKLYVFNEVGEKVASYRISTSARGIGDGRGTYATPAGKLEIAAKIGAGAPVGTVFKAGRRTGEICKINARGRDPIVTRILHLRGLESRNAHAYGRCIYIHGTPDEKRIGQPVSYGCIRMRSADVIELFEMVNVGTSIEITSERVSGLFGGVARRPMEIKAVASAPVESQTRAAVSASSGKEKPPKTTYARTTASDPLAPTKSGPLSKPASSGGSVKLLETSGLTINFGGTSEASDRPR